MAGLGRALIQAKLAVGPAGDRYEQEADAVAARVVRSLSGGTPDPVEGAGGETDERVVRSTWVGRPPENAARRIGRIQRSATVGLAGGAVDADSESMIRSSHGGGRPMPKVARSRMEGAFGADFSAVRVHEGSEAAELNERIQAKAFTVGTDVYFRDGMPDTSSTRGQELLAHELTHVVQQGGGATGRTDDRLRRTVVDGDAQALTVEDLMPTAADNAPDGMKQLFKDNTALLKKLIKILVNSGETVTRADFDRMQVSNSGLALPRGGAQDVDYSSLKTKKRDVKQQIDGSSGRHAGLGKTFFETALSADGKFTDDEMLTDAAAEGLGGVDPEELERQEANLANLLSNVPRVKIKKGTWLMHMTASGGDWLKNSMVGQNDPSSYGFFTLYKRGPATTHASLFQGGLVYSLTREVSAFYIDDYAKIVKSQPRTIYGAGETGGDTTSSVLSLGNDFVANILQDLPENKRPIAFASPTESELVFASALIPAILAKEGLVTKKGGGLGSAEVLTDPDTRVFHKFHM